ncbi:MAG: glycosyltransferase [Chloroflexia bacterium]
MSNVGRHLVSVIVATFNRVDTLPRTLEALQAMQGVDFDQEWIVVDNNSSDETAQFVAEYAAREPRLRYLFEPRQGKSFALNTGIVAAHGDILAFTDDDVLPAQDWLVRMVEVYNQLGARAAVVGGRVLVEQEVRVPKWLHRDLVTFLGLMDKGNEMVVVEPPQGLIGANMSARKDVLDRVQGFRTDLGPRGRSPSAAYAEDYDLCYKVAALKECGDVLYAPQLLAYHTMVPDKMTRRFFRQRALGEGKAQSRLYPPANLRELLLGTVQSLYYLLRLPLTWLLFSRVPDERFLREFKFFREWSALAERWRIVFKRIMRRRAAASSDQG